MEMDWQSGSSPCSSAPTGPTAIPLFFYPSLTLLPSLLANRVFALFFCLKRGPPPVPFFPLSPNKPFALYSPAGLRPAFLP